MFDQSNLIMACIYFFVCCLSLVFALNISKGKMLNVISGYYGIKSMNDKPKISWCASRILYLISINFALQMISNIFYSNALTSILSLLLIIISIVWGYIIGSNRIMKNNQCNGKSKKKYMVSYYVLIIVNVISIAFSTFYAGVNSL